MGRAILPGVHRTMGIMYLLALAASLLFSAGALLLPERLISIYSRDAAVIAEGASYLRIVGLSYVVTAFSYTMGFACRATGNVRLPMLTSLLSVATNTLLNSILIFGLLGFPELGAARRGDRHGHRARGGAHGAGHGRLPQAHARRGEFPPALPAL